MKQAVSRNPVAIQSIILVLSLIGGSVSALADIPMKSGQNNKECFKCHTDNATHNRCIACHKSKLQGPTECEQCHNVWIPRNK